MTALEKLQLLKMDLQLVTSAFDSYLSQLLQAAEKFIGQEGITLTDSVEDTQLCVMYAAYLYRRRADPVAAMPRMLRYALNQRRLTEKGAEDVT